MPDPASATTIAYLALGANLGDRQRQIDDAVARLDASGAVAVVARSPVYETDAVSDDPQPPYLNAVLRVETSLSAADLLSLCLSIERALGRVRPPGQVKAARRIDIDVLLHGDAVIDAPALTVPHPRLLERPFVRIPLADVAVAGLRHPVTGDALDRAQPSPGVRPTGPTRGRGPRPRPVLRFSEEAGMTPEPSANDRPRDTDERRSAPRVPLEMWVEETTAEERYFRRAGNLSRGGLRLDHTIPLPIGTTVLLTFTLPGDDSPVSVSGQIVSSTGPDDLQMGLKFVDLTADARQRIDAYLMRIGADMSL